MTWTAILTVEPGWSIPDMGTFVAEWLSPVTLLVAVEADDRPDFEGLAGVLSVEPVSFAEARGTLAADPKISWSK